MDPARDWAIDRLVIAAPPHVGISCLTGVKHHAYVDGTYSPIQDFVGPIMFVGHRGCHSRDDGADLIESRGNGAPDQEGTTQSLHVGVLPVCVWSGLLLN
jgi:hypothetical protein